MKISEMLKDKATKPMQVINHPDFHRAAWVAKAAGADTPLDSFLRDSRGRTADKLAERGL